MSEELEYIMTEHYQRGYKQGRAEERVKVLERVKQRLLTYSVGDEVIIDYNTLFDELSEIEAEE